ncbi:kinesin-like protein KIN-7O [Osmia bicornis bicornis]|uniref:kinesin-like protein KIN-7O n=1 Tax=Osmia bicornis bicornis TaxID=1437191 RepID=UPI0010F93570|nr:kinesin-like protein KIN-7O [Osmia bicornis bicornis]
MSNGIKVGIKLKPLTKQEKDENLSIKWIVQENSIVSLDPEIKKQRNNGFQFDYIFDMNANNSSVFNSIVKPIVDGAIDGFDGIIFFYGQSNSGKTYTMLGTSEEPGVIPHIIDYIFHAISNINGREFLLRTSYLEIYDEKINDLLNETETDLKLDKNDSGQIVINCKEEITNSPNDMLSIMEKGINNKKTKTTNRNKYNSSHNIFRITIESQEIGEDSKDLIQVSQLNLVDLTGFVKIHHKDLTEECQIDISFNTLKSLIVQLTETRVAQKNTDCDNTRLTELLQSSLDGNALIALICTVTPVALDETYYTLLLASQAKNIKNEPQRNKVISATSLLRHHSKQLAELQIELKKMRNGNSIEFEEVESSNLQEKDHINYLFEQIKLLKSQIISGSIKNCEESSKYKSRRISKQYIPIFHTKIGLPTIKEMSPEKQCRKSIRESGDFTNKNFELLKCKPDHETKENGNSTEEKCVECTENDFSIASSNNSLYVTPEKQDSSVQTLSTPKNVLRKYIFDLTRDLTELREFTTLEKQVIREENDCCIHGLEERITEANGTNELSSNLIMQLEEEKIKLTEDLELKIQELDEIKNDIQSLRLDIEKLQKTIYLLTNENVEMSTKLTIERERFQKEIDELHTRISNIMAEKMNLENGLMVLNEQLQHTHSRASEISNDEQLIIKYQIQIDTLKAENIELSTIIAEKSRELETVKESKSLLYDHDCVYKDKVAILTEENSSLVADNNKFSTDLMDKIEENDMLKEQCNILRNKLSVANNMNSDEDDVDQIRSENKHLKAEIVELKMRITMLTDENTKFSNNLLETMEDLENSRHEKQSNNTLRLSTKNSVTKIDDSTIEVLQEKNDEILANKVVILQEEIKHLTRLNKKLSDLKLSSCSQCAHLKNLNENRRALKLEATVLNHKLEDLQRKFNRKCADTEALKVKVNQDLNLSFADSSFNTSFPDGMNVSFVEEKVQHLNNELQALKDDRDKLSILYKEKCDELEKLHDEVVDIKNTDDGSTPKKSGLKTESRIEKIQKSIDQVKDDIDELKQNSTNFSSVLNKFRAEKAKLLDEINTLRNINEELQQKVSNNEISAAIATEKAEILENEVLNMNKEIEQFSVQEKTIRSEKLMLEVELEDLKAERESKDILITGLHRTIDDLNESISSLKQELDLMTNQKNELSISTEMIKRKYEDELESFKKQYEELEKEKSESTEAEKRAILRAKELESDVEKLQADLIKQESLCKELQRNICQLENLLKESENEKETLKEKLQILEVQLVDSENNLVAKYKNEFESITAKFEEYTKESEIKLNKINETLHEYASENDNLKQKLTKLEDIELQFNEINDKAKNILNKEKVLINDNKKLKEELDTIRECMIKELKSLKHKINSTDVLNKTANEIFIMFLQAIMTKEEEIIKTMRESFEKDKQQLEDEKRQSADAEKRMILWVKELETETEKLQMDLTKHEALCADQQSKINHLERLLDENNYEKDILKEKIEALENDLGNLQTELDKQSNVDIQQKEEEIIVAQRREKKVQESYQKKEIELLSKMKFEKEMYEKRIEDLLCTIESYKTKNMELKSNIEGLEANEKQLKNIIDANSSELKLNHQKIDKLNLDFEQLTEAYNEVNREVEQKASQIENITTLLKHKCDMLSEYKNKLEIVMPDYELLQSQVKERKESIERYKEEIENLKMEKEKQITIIKDKLNSEEIKNVGLNKQLNELNNRNIALVEELDNLKDKYEELQQANAKLERKIRNSTSKLKAEAEMEELKDINKRLQNNLEGASNRINEMQDSKNKILKELVNLKGQYELLSRENIEMKKTLSSYKQNIPYLSVEEYDALLQEKNKIALELEGKKLLLNQRDRENKAYASQIKELTAKNKGFNNQLEKYIAIISERDTEISNLKDKLNVNQTENKLANELEEKLKLLDERNKKLEDQLQLHNEKVLHVLRKENSELYIKLKEYENKLDLKSSTGSSRSVSPAFENTRRRHSRNEMFNQRRQLEIVDIDVNENEDTCQILRKKIQELELQLVSKDGQIAALEIQIQSEYFPYQQKCKELEENLCTYRKRTSELNSEVRKLRKTINDIDVWECDRCRRWQINKREKACQTTCNNTSRSLNNGIMDDHDKITKLEKDKALIKDLCHSRCRRIKELEDKVRELEELQGTSALKSVESLQEKQHTSSMYFNKYFDLEKNVKPKMKENIPTTLIELTNLSNYRRSIWNKY